MNRIQKIALFNLIVISVAIAATGITLAILARLVGFPRAWGSLGSMGICGLTGLGPLLFRKPQGSNRVPYDERDALIGKRAAMAMFGISYLCFIAAGMTIWLIVGPHREISSNTLPSMVGGVGLIAWITWSIAILVQYGRKVSDGAS